MRGYMKNTDTEKLEKDFEGSSFDWMENIVKAAEEKDNEVGEIIPQCDLENPETCENCGS